MLHDFELASVGDEVAYRLSNAFCHVDVLSGSGHQLTAEESWQLLRTGVEAHATFLEGPRHQAAVVSADDLKSGFRAFATLVTLMSEDEKARSSGHLDMIRDARDELRIFRNLCHNLALRHDIDLRRSARHAGESRLPPATDPVATTQDAA